MPRRVLEGLVEVDECYRGGDAEGNRRWTEARRLDRLLVAAVNDKAVTYKQLVAEDS